MPRGRVNDRDMDMVKVNDMVKGHGRNQSQGQGYGQGWIRILSADTNCLGWGSGFNSGSSSGQG